MSEIWDNVERHVKETLTRFELTVAADARLDLNFSIQTSLNSRCVLQIHPKASEDKKRLAESFDTARLRGDVAAIGKVFAVDE